MNKLMMMTEEQFTPGPLLVFSKPGENFPFGMLGFTEFCGHDAFLALVLQVHFADHQSKWQRDLSTQSKPVTKQMCYCSYRQQQCCHACSVCQIICITCKYKIFFSSQLLLKKTLLYIFFALSIKDLIFRVTIRTLKCPRLK